MGVEKEIIAAGDGMFSRNYLFVSRVHRNCLSRFFPPAPVHHCHQSSPVRLSAWLIHNVHALFMSLHCMIDWHTGSPLPMSMSMTWQLFTIFSWTRQAMPCDHQKVSTNLACKRAVFRLPSWNTHWPSYYYICTSRKDVPRKWPPWHIMLEFEQMSSVPAGNV